MRQKTGLMYFNVLPALQKPLFCLRTVLPTEIQGGPFFLCRKRCEAAAAFRNNEALYGGFDVRDMTFRRLFFGSEEREDVYL